MWSRSFIIVSFIVSSAIAITVPVDGMAIQTTQLIPLEVIEGTQDQPTYYLPTDEKTESYVIPPHQLEEIEVPFETPATYLLPPAPGKHIDYYFQSNESEETGWYPINSSQNQDEDKSQNDKQNKDLNENQNKNRNEKQKKNQGKNEDQTNYSLETMPEVSYKEPDGSYESDEQSPSRNLVPPHENAQNDFIKPPSIELELPKENEESFSVINLPQLPSLPKARPNPVYIRHMLPGPYQLQKKPRKYNPTKLQTNNIQYNPTKLYPKKYVEEFKPISIPLNLYSDQSSGQVPRARPVKPFHPVLNADGQYELPNRDKPIYLYEKEENKRKLQPALFEKPPPTPDYSVTLPVVEQETSETNFGHPDRNIYPAPQRSPAPSSPGKHAASNGERTEFRMHGMKGPHSYQFGYDTGKGKNRQFRYEERDNDGHVKGHYGYMDRHGKLRVVNYDADPEHGFRAEAPVDTE